MGQVPDPEPASCLRAQGAPTLVSPCGSRGGRETGLRARLSPAECSTACSQGRGPGPAQQGPTWTIPPHLASQALGIKHTKGLDSPWRPVTRCCRLPPGLSHSGPGIHLAKTALVYHALKSQPVVHLPARAMPTACLLAPRGAVRGVGGSSVGRLGERRASSFPLK